MTNRDLYLRLTGLAITRSLEDYLRALRRLLAAHRAAATLPSETFAELLAGAATASLDPPAPARGDGAPGYAEVEATLAVQIGDLRAMAEAGTLADDMRFFGIDSPRGARWYNFEPAGYLECAMAGTFGGWVPGGGADNATRIHVPGLVAVTGADGKLTAVEPETIDEPVVELGALAWPDVERFLWCGQYYE